MWNPFRRARLGKLQAHLALELDAWRIYLEHRIRGAKDWGPIQNETTDLLPQGAEAGNVMSFRITDWETREPAGNHGKSRATNDRKEVDEHRS